MTSTQIKFKLLLVPVLFLSVLIIKGNAQSNTTDHSNGTVIIAAMKKSEGDLDRFMKMYTDESTMMMPTGPAGIKTIKELYERNTLTAKCQNKTGIMMS